MRPLELAQLADELGLDYVGVQDHPYQRRFHDTWTLMTAIAMRTQRISIFPDVACLPLRPPAMLASGPQPAHPMGIWLGVYKPRGLGLVGRLADGWVPSLGYVAPDNLDAGNQRIDEAAQEAGRDPAAITRVLNVMDRPSPELLANLALEHGMDTFLAAQGEEPET